MLELVKFLKSPGKYASLKLKAFSKLYLSSWQISSRVNADDYFVGLTTCLCSSVTLRLASLVIEVLKIQRVIKDEIATLEINILSPAP